MDPQLSHYTQFFIVITNLFKTNQITTDQKQLLKANLMKKEENISKLLIANSGPGKEMQLREALLQYLKLQSKMLQRRRSHKSKTVHFQQTEQEAPVKEDLKEVNQPLSSCAQVMIDQLSGVLQKHFEKFGSNLLTEEKQKLLELRLLIQKMVDDKIEIENLSPLRAKYSSDNSKLADISEKDSSDEDVYEKMLNNIMEIYRDLKAIFTGNLHTHLLLMQEDISYENLYSVLKFLLKILVDADEFTFFIRREQEWEVYSTQNDSIKDMTSDEAVKITEELTYIRPFSIHRISSKSKQYPQIEDSSKSSQYAQTSIVKFQLQMKNYEALFCLHWADKDKKNIKRKFINYANMYGFNKEVTHLAQFLVETIITAKVQFFNPLRFADQIQDIGISFMRISRFLLMEGIKKSLSIKFIVEKEQVHSTDENIKRLQESAHWVKIELKDTSPVTIIIKNMDLNKDEDKLLYSEILKIQERYDGYVKLCYEKSAFYKYFLRTTDSLLFDFNKSGELIFLSRPISKVWKDRYNLNFDPKQVIYSKILYHQIFVQNSIIANIEVNLQNIHENRKNQYLSNMENPQFEIFLKVVDNDFKGFTVIFHENEQTRLRQQFKALKMENVNADVQREADSNKSLEEDIQKSIQKSYLKHQTFKFLNQLDQTQDVGNSMIALFIPENELQQIIHRKSNPNLQFSKNEGNSPDIQQKDLSQLQDKRKSKMSSNQFIKYNKQIDIVDPIIFEIDFSDTRLDDFNFNIFDVTNSTEKQRLVYSILERNSFVTEYKMPVQQLAQFLGVLQRKYNKRNNQFHNYDHGIAVMQSTHYLCNRPKSKQFIDNFRKMATIVSGLCHDVSHTARTNMFMINSHSKLAYRYHDQSPLEQHHAATTMFMLKDPAQNFLQNLNREQFTQFRRILIDNILYTDIKVHFGLLKDFEARIKNDDNNKPFGQGDDDLKLLTGMIVHTADFNGGAKVFELSRIWSEKVNKEFSAQYEEEGRLGIQQTPFLKDLDKIHVLAKSEMGFFKVIVRPLWFTLNSFLVQIIFYYFRMVICNKVLLILIIQSQTGKRSFMQINQKQNNDICFQNKKIINILNVNQLPFYYCRGLAQILETDAINIFAQHICFILHNLQSNICIGNTLPRLFWECDLDCNSSDVTKDFSIKNIITQYDLYCERSSYVLLMYITAFLGCISGSLILGQFGDLFGRQYIIQCSIAISVFGLINQLLCVSLTHMVISTFITGFGVIGMYILIIVMINENCQEQKRQQSIMVMLMVWALGGVFAAFAHYQVNDWINAYFYFALLPFILSFFLIHFFIFESPKFFVSKQRYDEALIIYNKISKINKRGLLQMKDIVADLPDDFGKVVDEEIIKDQEVVIQNNDQLDQQNEDQMNKMDEDQNQNITNKLQSEKERQNGEEQDIQETQKQEPVKLSTSSMRGKADNYTIIDLFKYDSLRSGTIGFMIVSFYLHLFYYGGQFGINKIMKGYDLYFTGACVSFGEFIVNSWRAHSTNVSLICSLIICLSFAYKQESLTLLMIQIAILRIFVTFAFGILSIYPNEFYPTEVRSLGSGFVYGIGILATILSPVVIFYGTQLGINPYLFMGLISIISPIGGLYVKETLGIELQDKIQKNHKS